MFFHVFGELFVPGTEAPSNCIKCFRKISYCTRKFSADGGIRTARPEVTKTSNCRDLTGAFAHQNGLDCELWLNFPDFWIFSEFSHILGVTISTRDSSTPCFI